MKYRIAQVLPATRQIVVACEGLDLAMDLPLDLDVTDDRAVHDFILSRLPMRAIERAVQLRETNPTKALERLAGREGVFSVEEARALQLGDGQEAAGVEVVTA